MNVRYLIPVSHSSLSSTRTAVTSLSSDASLGKSVATRVRRLSSLFCLSSMLVVRILFRYSAGSAKFARPSGMFASAQFLQLEEALAVLAENATARVPRRFRGKSETGEAALRDWSKLIHRSVTSELSWPPVSPEHPPPSRTAANAHVAAMSQH